VGCRPTSFWLVGRVSRLIADNYLCFPSGKLPTNAATEDMQLDRLFCNNTIIGKTNSSVVTISEQKRQDNIVNKLNYRCCMLLPAAEAAVVAMHSLEQLTCI